jgi:hypothetical protein
MLGSQISKSSATLTEDTIDIAGYVTKKKCVGDRGTRSPVKEPTRSPDRSDVIEKKSCSREMGTWPKSQEIEKILA